MWEEDPSRSFKQLDDSSSLNSPTLRGVGLPLQRGAGYESESSVHQKRPKRYDASVQRDPDPSAGAWSGSPVSHRVWTNDTDLDQLRSTHRVWNVFVRLRSTYFEKGHSEASFCTSPCQDLIEFLSMSMPSYSRQDTLIVSC